MELSLKDYLAKYGKEKTIETLIASGMEKEKAIAEVEKAGKEKEQAADSLVIDRSDATIEELKAEMKTMSDMIKEYVEKPMDAKIKEGVDGPKAGFKSLAEQAFAVATYRKTGQMDKRLEPLFREKAAGTGPDSLSGPAGGFLLAPEFATQILGQIPAINPIVAGTQVMTLSGGNTIRIPAMVSYDESSGAYFNGIQVYRRAEKAQLTPSAPEWAMIQLLCEELIGYTAVTLEMISRSPQSLEAYLRQMFTYAMGRTLEKEIVQGSGAAGQFLGLINSPCVNAMTVESGQTTDNPVLGRNITHMIELLAPECSNPRWIIHPKMLTELVFAAEYLGTSGELLKWFDPRGGTLAGFPVNRSWFCSAVNTTGDIILTDLSFYIRAVESGMDRWDMSEHFLFDYVQDAFRMIMSNDGQCWWKSKRLEADGSSYTSPIVTLATRS